MGNLIKVYFGDAGNGTLGRLQYLGYSVVLSLAVLVLGMGIGILLGVSEHLVGGNIQDAQAILREQFSGIIVVAFVVFSAVFGYALLNIIAKRVRDMGLPAWPVVIAIIVVTGMAAQYVAENVQQGISTAEMLALLLIPSGVFGRGKPRAG